MQQLVPTIESLYALHLEDNSIYISSYIIGIIDDDPTLIEAIKDINIIKFINESRDKYHQELQLLIEANEEQTTILNQFEKEELEKIKLKEEISELHKEIDLLSEKNYGYDLYMHKQTRIYQIISRLILLLVLIIVIFGINMLLNNTNDKALDHFKDIVLLVLGICGGSISGFIGTSRIEAQGKGSRTVQNNLTKV